MNILFVSRQGDSLGLVERVQSEGHNVFLHIVNKEARGVGEGMVVKSGFDKPLLTRDNRVIKENVKQLAASIKPDLIVFDTVSGGKIADYLRSLNYPLIGGSWWADNAQLDREYGKKLMKQVGISPHAGEKGVEVSCELWWNGLTSHIHNLIFVDRHFMSEGVGTLIDCAGCVVKMVKPKMKVVNEGIGLMERLLKRTTYRGPITLHSVITKDKLYGVSFTVRFGRDSLQALFELHKGNITQLLHNVAMGTTGYGVFTGDYAIAVRLSIPPYPNSGSSSRDKIGGVNDSNKKHIWWKSVQLGDGYESAGTDGQIGAVVARGRSVGECRSRVYRTMSNLTIDDMQYRVDIGKSVNKDMEQLSMWGWL